MHFIEKELASPLASREGRLDIGNLYWQKPFPSFIKVNTDESYSGGYPSCGGIVRDDNTQLH